MSYLPTSSALPTGSSGGSTPNYSQGNGGFFGNQAYQTQNYNVNTDAFTNPVDNSTNTSNNFATGANNLLAASGNAAPQIAPTATSAGAFPQTAGITTAGNTLLGIGTGAIPGAAATQAAATGQQQQANNLSAIGSAMGTANPNLAGYRLGIQNAATQQQQAQAAATAGAQEQLGALNTAGSTLGSAAQITQQNEQFNAQQINTQAYNQAQLQGQQLGLQGSELEAYINANATQIANTMSAAQAGQQLQVQNNLGLNQIGSSATASAANHSIGGDVMNMIGSGVGAAAGLMTKSDRRSKKNIKPGKKQIDEFLTNVRKLKKVV